MGGVLDVGPFELVAAATGGGLASSAEMTGDQVEGKEDAPTPFFAYTGHQIHDVLE
jgi:hypothetical protein